jgi:uncharacterized protein GlcG (DUF336 family)
MHSKTLISIVGGFAILLVHVPTPVIYADGLPMQKMLTIDVALSIAQEAMMRCRADGYKVAVTVVDSTNVPKVVLRDDGAGLATVEVGWMKAKTAMALGMPSGPPSNIPAGTPVPAFPVPGMIYAQGGVPIKVGDQVIGAVAVSGAPGGEKDAACAAAAVTKVASKLN